MAQMGHKKGLVIICSQPNQAKEHKAWTDDNSLMLRKAQSTTGLRVKRANPELS
jgi:hypothetical protein